MEERQREKEADRVTARQSVTDIQTNRASEIQKIAF